MGAYGMNHSSNVPNVDELNEMLKKVVDLARFKAKISGTFIVYEVNQKMIREYPDGSKYEVIRDDIGQQKVVPFHG
ncbi:hypothetical protein [Ferroacidibacillus organovorans]|uniref:Uncharacterized protein n=1 Tax=Ferroacidibacillus organovorans TaxID=1765683 RepID=A0A124IVP4_9BACL|nr:hypothetical protein [Ferroacidibacillus organovorans]KUO94895.1 hypothetical protein ATW55_15495 [Ferroacidibacillus organovorans]